MSWDIYGNPLRRGYCEVHPDVHQEYPCSICMAQKQQQSQPHNELEQLQYEFAQQGDYIRHLESERVALAAQAESLLDDRKEFVKKEFQLLKEIERLEIELKKRDEQNAALAAQLDESRQQHATTINRLYEIFNVDTSDGEVRAKWALLAAETCKNERDSLAAQVAGIKDEISDFLAALDGMLMADLSSEEIADDLEKRLSNYDVPQQHLAEIRAQAGRAGYLQGIADYQQAEAEYKDFWIDTAANQYADNIRQGGAA